MTHVTFWGWVGPAKNPDVYFSWVSWGVKRYNSIRLNRKDKEEEEGFQPQETCNIFGMGGSGKKS